MDTMLNESLAILGLSNREISAYLSLVELGRASPAIVAKHAQIPRSTAYATLELLHARGLLRIEEGPEGMLFAIKTPTALIEMVTSEKVELERQVEQKRVTAEAAVTMVSAKLKNQNYSSPKFVLYEGQTKVEQMLYAQFPIWQESIAKYDNTWWGYQDHQVVASYQDWIQHHAKQMRANERVLLYSNQSEIERQLKGKIVRREIRLWPIEFEFSSTFWILGDYIVTLMIRTKPHYAHVIQDSVMAANQRTLFKTLWARNSSL